MNFDTRTQRCVADAYLARLLENGVEYIFANAGTDFPPLIESLAKAKALGTATPRAVTVPHENVAVAMAYGAYLATGRMQAVMVHVGLGTANALMGIINAARQNIPMLIAAGRTPVSEEGMLGARTNHINWAQEMFDQAGMLREFVKWEYELRMPGQIDALVDRACALARTAPCGPVYLTLPREVFTAADLGPGANSRVQVATPAAPNAEAIAQLTRWLVEAERPLLITSNAGRTAASWDALSALAERLAIPVVQTRPRYIGLPSGHPMHCGYGPGPTLKPLLADADLVLVLESDVPWLPLTESVAPTARVAHIGADPLFGRYPVRGFPVDLAITSDLDAALASVLSELGSTTLPDAVRAVRISRVRAAQARRPGRIAAGSVPEKMSARWISACIEQVKDDDTVIFNEYSLALEEISVRKPGTVFCYPPSGGLGWASGAALGYKIARPGATVIAMMGDGTYMFGNPTPAHFVSRAESLPVLTLIVNNRRWGAVTRATQAIYPDGYASRDPNPPLSMLDPSPDYEKIVEASQGWGEKVVDPAALPEAMRRALRVVREEGRQAVLNIVCEE